MVSDVGWLFGSIHRCRCGAAGSTGAVVVPPAPVTGVDPPA